MASFHLHAVSLEHLGAQPKKNSTCYLCPCSYKDVWVLPLAHAALLGVVKAFCNLLFATTPKGQQAPWFVVPSATRRLIQQRAQEITLTSDFNRPYR